MGILKQGWWAPLAAILALSLVGIALAFVFGEGTSNLLDMESTAAGILLSSGGAVALVAGLWTRPSNLPLGNVLVIVGAVLAAIWVWIVYMVPLAIAVIVGIVVDEVHSKTAPDSP